MEYQMIVYSTDVIFARMLELEFLACGMAVLISDQPTLQHICETALLDLDSVEPPLVHTYGRMIGFTRDLSQVDEEVRRQCSMILHRPFEMSALRREVLGEGAGGAIRAQGLQMHEKDRLALDAATRTLTLDGQGVSLTPTEMLIASVLLENRGVPVSREQMALLIGESDANKTDVYVCYLRRKLSTLTLIPLIRTVRGKGYMIP